MDDETAEVIPDGPRDTLPHGDVAQHVPDSALDGVLHDDDHELYSF
ncbi:hypothetical protein AB0C76_33845 [Kitasatospora sp. NPDC048722]